MKNLFAFVIVLLFLNSCKTNSDGSIGEEISNGSFELSEKVKDSIILDWNQILKTNKINSVISELKILKEKDNKTKMDYYSIIGITDNDLAKIRTEIEYRNLKFYFSQSEITNLVICFGSNNCYPRLDDGKWFCDDGTNKPSCSLDCQKSVISTIRE